MCQLVKLVLHCPGIFLIAVSKGHDRNTCPKIQIFIALRIVQHDSFPVVKYHGKTVICLIKDVFRPFHQLIVSHDSTSHLLQN